MSHMIRSLLLLVLGLFVYANLAHYTAQMDSDIASEALLAKEIALNGMRVPDTWHASTEGKYFYPANLAGVFYVMTKNLTLSAGLGCSVYLLFWVILQGILYHRCGYKRTALWSALLLPLVLSVNLHSVLALYALYAGYYLYVFCALCILLIQYHRWLTTGRLHPGNLIVIGVIMLMTGIQGMLGVLMAWIPICVTELIRMIYKKWIMKETLKNESLFLVVVTAATLGTMCIVKMKAEGLTETSRNIRHAPDKFLEEVLPAFLTILSPAVNVLYSVCAWVIIVTSLCYVLNRLFKRSVRGRASEPALWVVMTFYVSLMVMIAAMTFTTTEAAPRYCVFLFPATAGGFGLFLNDAEKCIGKPRSDQRLTYRCAIACVILCAVFSASHNYRSRIRDDVSASSDYAQIARMMQSHGVTKGYAIFHWASAITVVSNDAVQVRPVNNMKDLEGSKWLSNEMWYPPHTDAEIPVAYITTEHSEAEFGEAIDLHNIDITETVPAGPFMVHFASRDVTTWR